MREKIKNIPWLSIFMLVVFMVPAFFVFPAAPKHEIVRVQPKTAYFDVIPERAVALTQVTAYKNVSLTEKVATISQESQLIITNLLTDGGKRVFQLSDGTYISASVKDVGSDVTLTVTNSTLSVFTTHTVNVLYSPFTSYDHLQYSSISGGQSFQTLKKATTHWGTYYEISFNDGRTGWVAADDISLEDPQLISLQATLQKKYGNNKHLSIAVKELDSNFTAGVNLNTQMYAASLWKLAVLYGTQKALNSGQTSLTDTVKYIPAVNNTAWGAFETSGTGNLPKTANNQNYQLLDIINRTAKLSDNVGSNLLGYYECDKFSPAFQSEINKIAGASWSPTSRNASPLMVLHVLEALYNEGGASFNALIGTDYDSSRIAAGVPANITVAHKIGIDNVDNHDAAIVFAKTPYLLVIMTDNSAPDSELTQISQLVYGALK